MMRRATRALHTIAVALGLVGLTLWIVPAPASPMPAAPPITKPDSASPDLPAQQHDLEALQQIVGGNIFSPTRSAPPVRFTPPGVAPAERRAAVTGTAAETPMRRYGTVVGPAGAIALIAADPTIRGAEIYRVGDRVGVRRIDAITDSTVVLSGPAGRLVLRLPQGARHPS